MPQKRIRDPLRYDRLLGRRTFLSSLAVVFGFRLKISFATGGIITSMPPYLFGSHCCELTTKTLGIKLQDAYFMSAQQFQRDEIARIFHIPLSAIQ